MITLFYYIYLPPFLQRWVYMACLALARWLHVTASGTILEHACNSPPSMEFISIFLSLLFLVMFSATWGHCSETRAIWSGPRNEKVGKGLSSIKWFLLAESCSYWALPSCSSPKLCDTQKPFFLLHQENHIFYPVLGASWKQRLSLAGLSLWLTPLATKRHVARPPFKRKPKKFPKTEQSNAEHLQNAFASLLSNWSMSLHFEI